MNVYALLLPATHFSYDFLFISSPLPALWDVKLSTQLAAWAAAVIAVSPMNHATLMAQTSPRTESAPLSIRGGSRFRGSPFLAAW